MNNFKQNFSLINPSQNIQENYVRTKNTEFMNRTENVYSKLSNWNQIKEINLSTQKINNMSIGKVNIAPNQANNFNSVQKRKRFAKLREMSKSHEV